MSSTKGHRIVNLQDYRARRTLALMHKYGIDLDKCQIQWYSGIVRGDMDVSVYVKHQDYKGYNDEWLNCSELIERSK